MTNKIAKLGGPSTNLTILLLSALLSISCAKGNDLSQENLFGGDSKSNNGSSNKDTQPVTGHYDSYYRSFGRIPKPIRNSWPWPQAGLIVPIA
jgi:hypothetical protein